MVQSEVYKGTQAALIVQPGHLHLLFEERKRKTLVLGRVEIRRE